MRARRWHHRIDLGNGDFGTPTFLSSSGARLYLPMRKAYRVSELSA